MSSKNRDIILFLLAGAEAVILILLPPLNPVVVSVLLVLLAGLLVHPLLQVPAVKRASSQKSKVVKSTLAIVLLVGVVSFFGYIVWPPPRYLVFSENQTAAFAESLHAIKNPQHKIRIGCDANEDICTSAAQFIDLFQKGEWTVRGNRVERGLLGKPQSGVTILVHGEGTIPDPDDPKWGLWTPAFDPERDAVVKAFSTLGITPHPPMSSKDIGDSEIAVIFGPPPGR